MEIDKLKAMLKRHEGLYLKPYVCPTGHNTVGWGHNLDAHGEPIPAEITIAQAECYLDQDIKQAIVDCARIPAFADLDPVRQAVLIDMAFNMGIGALLEFKRMLAAVAVWQYGVAAVEIMNSKYCEQVGDRARELAAMMLTGLWIRM